MSMRKILVCGDVNGHFKVLFSKVQKHQKNHSFDILLCVGNFFSTHNEEYEELKTGKIKVPIDTYIMNGNQPFFRELYEPLAAAVPKIVYLGKIGQLKCTSGITISFVSGIDLPKDLCDNPKEIADTFEDYNIYVSSRLVKSRIVAIAGKVDILLTSQWPKGVTYNAASVEKQFESKVNDASSYAVSYAAKYIKPRYHFCGLAGLYYERTLYKNHIPGKGEACNATRFVGLAPVKRGKTNKSEKWLYAINILPQTRMSPEMLLQNIDLATANPYDALIKDDDAAKDIFLGSLRHLMPQKRSAEISSQSKIEPKKRAIDENSCWFCLSSPNIQHDLIFKTGHRCYMAVAKGFLVPQHVIITPTTHIASSVQLSDEVFVQMCNLKQNLIDYFHKQNNDVIFYERNYRTSHLHIEAIPVPKHLGDKIEYQFYSYLKDFDVKALPISTSIKEAVPDKTKEYFFFEEVTDTKFKKKFLVMLCDKKNFPLQIGREIIAKALGIKDRRTWQECIDPEEEEEIARRMEKDFKK